MLVGDRIRQQRENKSVQQADLAAKVGITKQLLYKYESGIVTNIPSDKIEAIAAALGVLPEYFMGWVDTPNRDDRPYSKDEQTLVQGYRVASIDTRSAMLTMAKAALDAVSAPLSSSTQQAKKSA